MKTPLNNTGSYNVDVQMPYRDSSQLLHQDRKKATDNLGSLNNPVFNTQKHKSGKASLLNSSDAPERIYGFERKSSAVDVNLKLIEE